MRMTIPLKFAIVVALAWSAAGCVSPTKMASTGEPVMDAQSRRNLAENVVDGWYDVSRLAARVMMKRYGPPDEIGSARLVWYGNGPWKRTIVRDVPPPYAGSSGEDLGVIEQTVSYRVTPEEAAGLIGIGDRLSCDPARMELSSRADREEANFLRLNLANDVVGRVLTAQEASLSYTRILELEASGKTTQYMLGLRFGRQP